MLATKIDIALARHLHTHSKLHKMTAFHEFNWISSLPQIPHETLILGMGDDAALFKGHGTWAISTDSMIEDRHFKTSDAPQLIAKKLVNVNVSDMAAMGCEPKLFLLNLHLSPNWSFEQLEAFKVGLLEELKIWNMSLIGGDTVTCQTGPIHLVGTILGQPFGTHAITRSGAKVGDDIYVTGSLGGSFPTRHLTFSARVAWRRELCLHSTPSSMMDISDGLLQDLGHILDQSGVSAQLDLFNCPIHEDLSQSQNPLISALSDGEDFELLFTLAPEKSAHLPQNIPCTKIGRISAGSGEIFARKSNLEPLSIWPRLGFEHTAQNSTKEA